MSAHAEDIAKAAPKPETTSESKPKDTSTDLSTKEAYFASLAEWAKQAALMQMFPNYLLANYNLSQLPFPAAIQQTQQQQPAAEPAAQAAVVRPNFNRFRLLDEVQQHEIIQRVGGTEVVLAPFWKRAVAEAIDVFILFVLKIIITFSMFHIFDMDFDKDAVRKALEEDDLFLSFFDISMDFISMSSELLLIELLTKLLVCLYEGLWTVFYHGATPGKSLMKIRILYVEAVLPLQAPVMPQFVFQQQREPARVLLYPGETPALFRGLMRAFAKNLVMTLLFPICVVMIFFKNNRTIYDIITKTIVVETNLNPTPAANPQEPPQVQPRPHQD